MYDTCCFAAFAHGTQKGLLHERLFNYDYNIDDEAREKMHASTFVEHEWKLIKENRDAIYGDEKILTSAMKDLGMQR